MPKLSEFYGIQILMRMREANHPRPHFHAAYGEYLVVIAIDDLGVLAGFLPNRALTMVLDWASIHQGELQEAWDAIRSGQSPAKILPLP